jgi:hypothetical protein
VRRIGSSSLSACRGPIGLGLLCLALSGAASAQGTAPSAGQSAAGQSATGQAATGQTKAAPGAPSAASSAAAAPASAAAIGDPRDFDGVWWTPGYDRKYRTVEGELPPFTERGRREWEAIVKADERGEPVADAPTGCLPHGIPRLLASPYPIQIITTPGQMTWVHEVNRNQRWIYMDEKHPPNLPKTYLGHSVAHWEGDTLVIDTAGLNDKTRIDEEGITHSDQLHVVERIRKIEGGKALENLITITDPVMFTQPWTTKRIYRARPEVRIMEYVCEENNRNAPENGVTKAK